MSLVTSYFLTRTKVLLNFVRTVTSNHKVTESLSHHHKSKSRKLVRKHRKIILFDDHVPKLPSKVSIKPNQNFDYFVVLDFEANCDSPINVEPPEIIEFPAVKINGETLEIESTFHSYVRPVICPEISGFCSELTGIIQGMVESQPLFPIVFKNFLVWLEKENILVEGKKFAFVSVGDTDLDYFFPVQCAASNMEVPEFMKQWINIKRSFCELNPGIWPNNLMAMLKLCELEHKGDLHSGLDDAMNTARVLVDLAERGLVFRLNAMKK